MTTRWKRTNPKSIRISRDEQRRIAAEIEARGSAQQPIRFKKVERKRSAAARISSTENFSMKNWIHTEIYGGQK